MTDPDWDYRTRLDEIRELAAEVARLRHSPGIPGVLTTPEITFGCLRCHMACRAEIDLTDPTRPRLRHVWTLASGDTWDDQWKPLISSTEQLDQ